MWHGNLFQVVGLALFDCVEDTALASLDQAERHLVAMREQRFPNLNRAVAWAHHSGGLQRLASAKISTPPRLVESQAAVGGVDNSGVRAGSTLGEGWRWRTDLLQSKQWWRGWFEGLSELFLAQPVPKMVSEKGRLGTSCRGLGWIDTT
jgi:protein phosphatase methylesterase 1